MNSQIDVTGGSWPEWVTFVEHGWLNSNTVVIEAPRDSARIIVDTGYHPASPHLVAEIEAISAESARHTVVVNTHAHPDHTGGNAALQRRFGAEVWASEIDAMLLDSGDDAALLRYFGMGCPPFSVSRRLRVGESIDLAGRELRVVCGAGHSSGEISLYCPEEKLLVCGDLLWGRGFSNVVALVEGQAGLARHELSVGALAELDIECALPGHGPAIRGRAAVRAAIASTQERIRALRTDPAQWCGSSLRSILIMSLLSRGSVDAGAFAAECEASAWYREHVVRFGAGPVTDLEGHVEALKKRKLVRLLPDGRMQCTLRP